MNTTTNDSMQENLVSDIRRFAAEHEAAWIAYRRERHCAPEPSGEEAETSHSICERLNSLGIDAEIPPRGTGVTGDLLLGKAGPDTPAIAVRADIDALRMPDRKTVGYASVKDGLAHACGHDVHTTIVLAVAELLSHLKTCHSLPSARIRFLFQAAEETGDGAGWMVKDGFLRNVTSILGLHVEPNLLAGHVGIRYGVLTASVDEIFFTVRGRGGHTARPHSTTDPVHCAMMLISGLYPMLPRRADVRDASVFTVGQINAGHASNVIPDEVRIVGTLRTTEAESRRQLLAEIENISRHLADMTGNVIDLSYGHSLGSVMNSSQETRAFESAARVMAGEDAVEFLDRPSMGGEDFAVYLTECTGCQIRLGCATEFPWPHLHSPVFDVDESAIILGAAVMTSAVLNLAFEPANCPETSG